jgi:hypothetical protein
LQVDAEIRKVNDAAPVIVKGNEANSKFVTGFKLNCIYVAYLGKKDSLDELSCVGSSAVSNSSFFVPKTIIK